MKIYLVFIWDFSIYVDIVEDSVHKMSLSLRHTLLRGKSICTYFDILCLELLWIIILCRVLYLDLFQFALNRSTTYWFICLGARWYGATCSEAAWVGVFVWKHLGPLYLHGLTLIPACINDHLPSKVWDGITYPFLNFNGCAVEV